MSRPDSDLPSVHHAYWDLRPDECLLLEIPVPPAGYWGIQLANSLWNTLDFANRQTSLNRAQAHVDPDGVFRAVIAHSDPGIANWLDTLGHRQGAVLMRVQWSAHRDAPARSLAETKDDWMSGWADERPAVAPASELPVPTARVVAAGDLDAVLPAGTPRVTPAQRRDVLDERLRQVTWLQRS